MRKIAVITGGSKGIGAACAHVFAQNGWSVIILNRHDTGYANTLRSEGFDAVWYACDVTDAADTARVFAQIEKTYHRVDVLVNNAGISLIRMFTDTTEEDWRQVMSADLDGAYRCSRAVLPGMIRRGEGVIVNIASIWGEVGASCEVAYSAAKAGLIGMTKALAKEVGPSGIRVNCVSPGVIDTAMNAELGAETLQELRDETPLGKIGTP